MTESRQSAPCARRAEGRSWMERRYSAAFSMPSKRRESASSAGPKPPGHSCAGTTNPSMPRSSCPGPRPEDFLPHAAMTGLSGKLQQRLKWAATRRRAPSRPPQWSEAARRAQAPAASLLRRSTPVAVEPRGASDRTTSWPPSAVDTPPNGLLNDRRSQRRNVDWRSSSRSPARIGDATKDGNCGCGGGNLPQRHRAAAGVHTACAALLVRVPAGTPISVVRPTWGQFNIHRPAYGWAFLRHS